MPQGSPNDGGRLGIMGGAFDPIHNGHLILAEFALKANNLDGVLFIPSFNPPHRNSKPISNFEQRVHMTKLAIAGNSSYYSSKIEEEINGPGYTLSIIEHLKNKYLRTKWFLILGADNIAIFDSWHKPEEIVKLATIIVGGRPGYNDKQKESAWYGKIEHFEMPQTDISSTAIRQLLKDGISIENLVPASVDKYIQDKGLYR